MADALTMISPVLLGLFLGIAADRRFGTAPLFTLGLLFLGFATGFYSMYRRSKNE
jgi:F0F1-type ATP synthase assembly protein I